MVDYIDAAKNDLEMKARLLMELERLGHKTLEEIEDEIETYILALVIADKQYHKHTAIQNIHYVKFLFQSIKDDISDLGMFFLSNAQGMSSIDGDKQKDEVIKSINQAKAIINKDVDSFDFSDKPLNYTIRLAFEEFEKLKDSEIKPLTETEELAVRLIDKILALMERGFEDQKVLTDYYQDYKRKVIEQYNEEKQNP